MTNRGKFNATLITMTFIIYTYIMSGGTNGAYIEPFIYSIFMAVIPSIIIFVFIYD